MQQFGSCKEDEVRKLTTEIDRDYLIFTITMNSNYSEEYLKKLKDDELLELHCRISEQS